MFHVVCADTTGKNGLEESRLTFVSYCHIGSIMSFFFQFLKPQTIYGVGCHCSGTDGGKTRQEKCGLFKLPHEKAQVFFPMN